MGSVRRVLQQLLLVIEMVGLEGGIMVEVLMMIANLQALGVPLRLASLPGTVSASVGILLIPGLGLFMDRRASSPGGKARILVFTSAIHALGLGLVLAANVSKLMTPLDPDAHDAAEGTASHMSYVAVLAMAGYACIDCGFDASNCFMKTFALACTPAHDHSGIIVKNVLVGAFGGCITSVLASAGAGRWLVARLPGSLDAGAAQAAFCSALSLSLVMVGLLSTLLTGFRCPPGPPPQNVHSIEVGSDDSDSAPILESSRREELRNRNIHIARTRSRSFSNQHMPGPAKEARAPGAPGGGDADAARKKSLSDGDKQVYKDLASNLTSYQQLKAKRSEQDEDDLGSAEGGWCQRKRKQIIINLTTFFLMAALYAFEIYVPNFVGTAMYGGDAYAVPGTEDYTIYTQGIEFAGGGYLVFYVSFAVSMMLLQPALNKMGVRCVMVVASALMAALTLALALTRHPVVFFVASIWAGFFRSASSTVPYILANQAALEQPEGGSGVGISLVAAMLPLGFTLTSAVMGPVMAATQDPAAPLYFCVGAAVLGTTSFAFVDI